MPKITPIVHVDDNAFDGLDEVQNSEFHLHRGSKSKKRFKKKQTIRLDGTKSAPPDILDVVKGLVVGKKSIYIGSPFFILSMLLAMLLQLMPSYQRYNTIIILTIAASVEFKSFPTKSVRPQIAISLISLLSVGIDILQMATEPMPPLMRTTIVFVMFFKLLLLNAFFRNSQGAVRTRKYLDRRFRLFFIPLYEPRRIMRDVRGRMLAIGWLHLVASLFYFILFMLLVLYLDYSVLYLNPSNGSWLPVFLACKTVSSILLLLGILYDTDIRLCLWHFGCLGCYIEYVRKYIRRKRIELHGFPLVFSFGKRRYYIFVFLKVLDILYGMYGWILVGYSFGTHFMSLDTNLKILFGLVAFGLVVFDLWVGTLLLGIRWLLRRKKVVQSIGELLDSDDSEIEEFGLRTNLEEGIAYQKDKAALVEARRQLYYQRMRKEELRYAEKAYSGEHTRSTAAAVAEWIQQHYSTAARRSTASKNAIHPSVGFDLEALEAEEREMEEEKAALALEIIQTHPLMRQMQSHAGLKSATKEFLKNEAFWDHKAGKPVKFKDEHFPKEAGNSQIGSPQQSERVPQIKETLLQDTTKTAVPAVAAASSDEDDEREGAEVSVRSPLRRTVNSRVGGPTRSTQLAAAAPGANEMKNSIVPKTKADSPYRLVKALTLTPDQFAGVWEELSDCTVSTVSTALVPGQVLEDELSENEDTNQDHADRAERSHASKMIVQRVRQQQQALLSVLAMHLRAQGYSLASAGLHPQRVIKLLFYATAELTESHSGRNQNVGKLPENPALRMGLMEIRLFPGAVVPSSQGAQQSYLVESTCRCRTTNLGPVFLSFLAFNDIFKLID